MNITTDGRDSGHNVVVIATDHILHGKDIKRCNYRHYCMGTETREKECDFIGQ